MLRLAHRILSEQLKMSWRPDVRTTAFLQFIRDEFLPECHILVADDVYSYCEKYLVDLKSAPVIIPGENPSIAYEGLPSFFPFDGFVFVEWNASKGSAVLQHGWAFISEQNNGEPRTSAIGFATLPNGHPTMWPAGFRFYWTADRKVSRAETIGYSNDPWGVDLQSFRRAATALAFCNFKNIVRRDETESIGPARKWIRRTKTPTLRYYILNINPFKEVLRTTGGIEKNGLLKAMHICRGHESTYTEEKPLFGKPGLSGTFWIPAHVRGSIEQGIVDKDYRVKAPQQPQ